MLLRGLALQYSLGAQDMWLISGHLLWQEQWHKTNKWCHYVVHGMGSMSPCLEHHSTMCTHLLHPMVAPATLYYLACWFKYSMDRFLTSIHRHSSEDFFQFHAAAAYCMHAEGFSLGCSCHHYYAATDCAWFVYLIFLHSPVHTSWNSINVVNNSRLEYLRLAIIFVFLLRAICSSSYGPYLCQQIKLRLDWCRFADPRTNVYF